MKSIFSKTKMFRWTNKRNFISPRLMLLLLLLYTGTGLNAQQQNPSRTMLQGFWWGSWSDTYSGSYYNYLTRLAPRLRLLGIDAIWVFPPQKAGQKEVKSQ